MTRRTVSARRILEIVVAVAVLLVVFVWMQGLLREKIGPDSEAGRVGRHPYDGPAAVVERREIAVEVEAVGTVRAINEASIAARVTGAIERIRVEEGDRVTKGETLVVLSAPELAARHEAARQAVTASEATLRQARSDYERMDGLYAEDAATKVEWEQARTALSVAEAELSRARQAAAAEEALASYRELNAPFDGVILERRKDPGDLAGAGETILRLVDDGEFQLEANVDETIARDLRQGTAVRVQLGGISSEQSGTIAEVIPATDPGSRTVVVKVALHGIPRLMTGQFGRMRFRSGSRMSLVVPPEAVKEVGGLSIVHVVGEEGFTVARYVRPGRRIDPDSVEILAGLTEGERVAAGPVVGDD